jgi:hypothetical protein
MKQNIITTRKALEILYLQLLIEIIVVESNGYKRKIISKIREKENIA